MILKSFRYVTAQRCSRGSSKDVLEEKRVGVVWGGKIQGEKTNLYIKQLTAYRHSSSRGSICGAADCVWYERVARERYERCRKTNIDASMEFHINFSLDDFSSC